MKSSNSHYHPIRSLRYHVRTWGDTGAPILVLLHGWMDVGASFQFAVDALVRDWHVVAPDWRGFGQTQWASDGYWFLDYVADLDHLLDIYSPQAACVVVGHSMGANVANLYAGIRPERISHLVLAEGFGLKPTRPEQAPDRIARWLDETKLDAALRPYASFAAVADRMMKNNPRLDRAKAEFLAGHWAARRDDGTIRLAADPRHKRVSPVLYRFEEAIACWERITAPVLWIWGDDPADLKRWAGDDPAQWDRRRAAFRQLSECTIAAAGHMMHHDQ
ncbi:MAG: alpha/beta fold hydrolase, partial [Betaproteobacteria bacterium]